MKTSMGEITIELNQEKAPITVKNFLQYVEDERFDGTIFHRVIGNFMIQGGGFEKGEPPTERKTMRAIRNEAKASGLSNLRGTIAMARTREPHSATSQFFINVIDNNESLDPGGVDSSGYAVFGRVTSGMDTVDKIKRVKTGPGILNMRGTNGQLSQQRSRNTPLEQVVIESVRLKVDD
ncbi:MAG: peptidylprolyl isomerase [Fuerstiella sp.]|nr:peptidylprolyl isomerase [Fuerstiella sp.]